MSRKFSAARKQAFLDAVRETGNQTIAAERAKVSRSWVQLHRSSDPAFDAAVRGAIAEARRHFDPSTGSGQAGWGGGRKPPSGWGFLDGEELVVKGVGGSGGDGGRRVQIARARVKQWTPRVEDRFLAVVAATCNVRAACAEVGMTVSSAYAHRRRWPAFARRWDEAVACGTAALESALLEAAANLFSSPETPAPAAGDDDEAGAPAIVGMDAHQALHLLYMHKHYAPRPGHLPGRPPTRATERETIAAIERQFALLAQRRRKEREKERRKGRDAVS
jgi:hypothetical protein